MNSIDVSNITKTYESFTLHHFSLNVEKGQLYGILGPNGSGKSTIINLLSGQLKPNSGKISILNTNPITNSNATKEVIGIIPEQETPPSFLTIREYLEFVCSVREVDVSQIDFFLKEFELKEYEHSLIKNLSRGNKQKVLFSQAFIHSPKVVLIDEPLINLDPIMQKKMKQFLVNYVKKGNSILLSTHILSIAQEICTHICILRYGKTLYQGNMRDIVTKKTTLEDYFMNIIEKSDNKSNKQGIEKKKKSNSKSEK
ncbi:MAG: ABC transporter ATP-binding protein [Candidatus Nanoarchaeia archaeon]